MSTTLDKLRSLVEAEVQLEKIRVQLRDLKIYLDACEWDRAFDELENLYELVGIDL